MRQKISTLIDPGLYRRVKLEAVKSNRQISEIVGEALECYLRDERRAPHGAGAVAESWGALKLPASEVGRLLEDDDGLLDA
jgi:hypothetical protein